MKSKLKGNLGVIKAIELFADYGCIVSLPFGDVGDYDLVVDYEGRLLKIQCKASETFDGDKVAFNVAVTSRYTRKRYKKDMTDYLFLYDIVKDEAFIIEPDGKTEVTIRYTLPKNGQKAKVRMADDYSFANIISKL